MYGPPLILLHGALGDARQMKPVAEVLPSEIDTLAVEFSGHGLAADVEQFTIDQFVDDVVKLMDSRAIETADFFGYSMGGYVAIRMASSHPDRVGKIMTLGTKFDWTPESAASEIRMLDPDSIHKNVPAFAAMLKKRHGARWPEVCELTADMLMRLGRGDALQLQQEDIPHPIRMCVGELDTMAGVEATRKAASHLTGATLHVLPGVQHPIEKIDLEMLASLILVWRQEGRQLQL